MRESENYRATLEDVREKANRLYPDKLLFSATEIARMLGCDRTSIYRLGFRSRMTAAEIARTLCRRGI